MPIFPTTDRRRATPQRDRQGGFTLMEVVLAMAIMAMLAALGLPYLRPNATASLLRTKTTEIAGLLRADRDEAIRSGRTATVLIDARRGVVQSSLSRLTVIMPSGVTLRTVPDGAGGVSFLADGSSSGARIALAANDVTYIVDVNRITAAVQISGALR